MKISIMASVFYPTALSFVAGLGSVTPAIFISNFRFKIPDEKTSVYSPHSLGSGTHSGSHHMSTLDAAACN
ncbi:hypothetical protein QBC35DRAFT_480811 [Podospora australis]|uniref:Uncharacterized protein n=1 Tax=Podospora australis TaxID=1536484 RepID=A0AAN6X3W3_9PEZI|nr:hypothetical protein QBC35DRAFT_480811 [Podospora australis]